MGDVHVHELGDAEVGDFDLFPTEHDDVRRLDIAVDDALGVRVVDRGRDLRHQAHDDFGTESLALEKLRNGLAFDILHREPGDLILGVADVVERDDVGVRQPPRGAGLGREPI